MSERDRKAATSAERGGSTEIAPNRAQDTLGTMDDAQVMDLVSDAYWALFERFLSLDRTGTSVSSVATAA